MLRRLPSYLLLAAFALSSASYADGTSAASDNGYAGGSSDSAIAQSAAPPLQGSVKKTAKAALEALKAMGEEVHKLKRASAELYAESTRHEIEIIDEPDMIGSTVIDIPVSFDTGQPLPPRKKWVDFYMTQLSQLVPMTQDEINGILIPAAEQTDVAPTFSDLTAKMKDIDANYNALTLLTKTLPYPSDQMAAACKNIDTDVKSIQETEKKVYHLVKKDS